MEMPKQTVAEKREYSRKWHEANREHVAKKRKKYYEEHRAELLAYMRAYNADSANKERRQKRNQEADRIVKRRAVQKDWRIKRGERHIEKQRLYFHNHRAHVLAKNREWYKRNRAAVLARKREYFQENAVKLVPYRKAWVHANRDKVREYIRVSDYRRRSAELINGGYCNADAALLRADYHEWKCRYCSKSLTRRTLTLDHMIPIRRGGSNWPSNLVPCCKSCNSSKGKKTYREFILLRKSPSSFCLPIPR